eukprot:g1283.t1
MSISPDEAGLCVTVKENDVPKWLVERLRSSEIFWLRGKIINPDTKYMRRWDIWIMLCLIFTAFVTPYEVAFMETKLDFLFCVNRFVDLTFLCDMLVQFMLPFQTILHISEHTAPRHFWVVSHKKIAKRYLKQWFLIDLISLIQYDLIGMAAVGGGVDDLAMLRIMRCARLIKLVRIIRASKLMQKLKVKKGVKSSTIKLFFSLVVVCITVHWLACIIGLTTRIEGGEKGWLPRYYKKVNGKEKPWPATEQEQSEEANALYLFCMYYAISTLTGMGIDVSSETTLETFVTCVGMAVGASVYAFIVGAISSAMSNRDPVKTEFNVILDQTNNLLAEYHIPNQLQQACRNFHLKRMHHFRVSAYQAVLETLSPELHHSVMVRIHQTWVSKVHLLNGLPEQEKGTFIVKMLMSMTSKAYAPGESIIRAGDIISMMYIIKEGIAAKLLSTKTKRAWAKTLLTGELVGENIIISTRGFACNFELKTVTFLIMQQIDKADLQEILIHPKLKNTTKHLRRKAIKQLFADRILVYCRIFQSLQTWMIEPAIKPNLHCATGEAVQKYVQGKFDLPDDEEELHDCLEREARTAQADSVWEETKSQLTKQEFQALLAEQKRTNELLEKLAERDGRTVLSSNDAILAKLNDKIGGMLEGISDATERAPE